MKYAILFVPLLAIAAPVAAQTADEDKLVMELVKRARDFDMATASPKVLAAVSRSLESSRGSKSYFEFVQRHKVTTEAPHLLKMAMERPDKPEAGSAFQTIFAIGMGDAIKPLLLKTPKEHLPAVGDAIVLSQKREAVELLMSTITDPAATPEYRQSVVKSLGRSRNGELALLEALKENALPMDVLYFSSQILHGSADASVRENAEKLLPMPKTIGDKPLPPVRELIKRSGDVANGKTVFGKFCLTCHKVGDEGLDFGPALGEIGSKLPKEALYQAVLDTNAGISFGYEGFEIKTKGGDNYIGMIASETDTELSVKVPGGVIVKVAKADVDSRKKLPVSLMTPGLASAMKEEEFVDVIEYMSSLKKK